MRDQSETRTVNRLAGNALNLQRQIVVFVYCQ